MKDNIKKRFFLISFFLVLISIIGFVSYSYYVSEIYGNESESTVAITGGNIIIKYQNDSSDIVASGIYIGWSTTKEFTVSYSINASNIKVPSAVSYDMLLIVDRNDFLTGSLQYQLMPNGAKEANKTGIYSDSSYYDIPTGSSLNGILMGKGFLVDQNVSHSYLLSIKYIEQPDVDQYVENDAIFNARVNINGSSQDSYGTLHIDLNGGEISGIPLSTNNTIKVPMNKEFILPTPTKESGKYSFTGWELVEGSATISGNSIIINDSDVTIRAIYSNDENPAFYWHSWETIAAKIKSGNTSEYNVGDTREIKVDGFYNEEAGSNGLYTVRIANNSTPSECSAEGFSQTACGFVIEFVDIITGYNMNPAGTYNDAEYPDGTNLGGWPSSAMYKYVNGDTSDHLTYESTNATIYSKLPSDLRSAIIDTYAVSGHGPADTGTRSDENFESTDKLYLLTAGEVWGDCLTSNCSDTASYPYSGSGGTTTRQLDYYQSIGVSKSSYSGAIKQKNGSNSWWWLRAASPYVPSTFRNVYHDGTYNHTNVADTSGGIAPAFRIG